MNTAIVRLLKPLLCFTFVTLTLLLASCGGEPPSRKLEVAINGVHGGALSNDGAYGVVGSVYHGGSFWRLADGERLYNWNHSNEESSVFIAADIDPTGRWAISSEAFTMVLWDIASGQAARFWTAPGEVLDMALVQGGSYTLLGLADHSAVIFNTLRGGISRTFTHQGRVRSVDLSTDGRLAITGSEDQTAVVWDVNLAQAIMTMPFAEDVQKVAISGNGRYAFTAAKYDKAQVWDIELEQPMFTLPLAKEKLKRGLRITAARFSEDGRQLLLGYANRNVELWDIDKRSKLKTWQLSNRHKWQPTAVAPLDVAFTRQSGVYTALGSNGFVFWLE